MERTIRFGLLLSPAEKQALTRLAEFEGGLSQGAMIRHLIRDRAREHSLWQTATPCEVRHRDKTREASR